MGVAQTGLNLPMASYELFYNRSWSPRQEQQALFRALRPQQRNRLGVEFVHLRGSLDEYQARMVDMKSNAAAVGLDWGTPEYTSDDFQHWLSILDGFVDGLAEMRGVDRHQFRHELATPA